MTELETTNKNRNTNGRFVDMGNKLVETDFNFVR
ncbi:hypothetical protein BH11BAC7_BH11BAC7_21520 [soil metagenome]